MNKLVFCVFFVCSMSYKIATYFEDSDCSTVLEEYIIPEFGTYEVYRDGSIYSGECYDFFENGEYTEFRCKGGEIESREYSGTDSCEGEWDTEDDEDDDHDDDECECDATCCEIEEDVMYMECYCENLKTSDAMLLTALILTFVPCCWIGCCCIIWLVALIMCCVCGSGCFDTL